MHDKRPYLLLDEDFAQWRWTHAYVENVAHAIVSAITNDRSAGRIYNVGEPETPSMLQFIHEIGQIMGWSGDILCVPKEKLPETWRFPLNTLQPLIVDSQRIRQELGYREPVNRETDFEKQLNGNWPRCPKRASEWYSRVLGLKRFKPEGSIMIMGSGQWLFLMELKDRSHANFTTDHWERENFEMFSCTFETEDIVALHESLRANGAEVEPIRDFGGCGLQFRFKDPDGNKFNVWQT